MAWRVIDSSGRKTGVPLQATAETPGTAVGTDGDAVGAAGEVPVGFVIDDTADDNNPQMVDAYGNGCILEDTSASFTAMEPLYSDGDGTISHTASEIVVGTAITATKFLVNITSAVNA